MRGAKHNSRARIISKDIPRDASLLHEDVRYGPIIRCQIGHTEFGMLPSKQGEYDIVEIMH